MAAAQYPPENLNLFRRSDRPDFYCAVPERLSLPPFIRSPRWEFAGNLQQASTVPVGFRERAARLAFRHHGFYPFDRIH
jgi:hypothetical protein